MSVQKLVNSERLEVASSVIRALAHPLRLRIIAFIDENRKINVNKIYKSLRLEQSIASQHLSILRAEGLVIAERQGKYIFYTVNYEKLEQIEKAIQHFFST